MDWFLYDNDLRHERVKYDVSDHFPNCLTIPCLKFSSKNKIIYTYKRSFLNDIFLVRITNT